MESHPGCFSIFFLQSQPFLHGINDRLPTRMYAETLKIPLEIRAFPVVCRRVLASTMPTFPFSSFCWITDRHTPIRNNMLAKSMDLTVPPYGPIPLKLTLITSRLNPNLFIIIAAMDGVGQKTLQLVTITSMFLGSSMCFVRRTFTTVKNGFHFVLGRR